MKQGNSLSRIMCSILYANTLLGLTILGAHGFPQLKEIQEEVIIPENYFSDIDYDIIAENPDIIFAYIPPTIKKSVEHLCSIYQDINFFSDATIWCGKTNVAPYDNVKNDIQQLLEFLILVDFKKHYPEENICQLLQNYLDDLESGDAVISVEQFDQDITIPTRSRHCKVFCNLFVRGKATICDLQAVMLNISGKATIYNDLRVYGKIYGTIAQRFGNTVLVDKVYGDNVNGQRNGSPFLTINAALAVALPGDLVWIFPGIYNESLTIPTGVSIRGANREKVIISRLVSSATDLVIMSENSSLEDVTLQLTSNLAVKLRGIVFPGTTSATAQVRSVTLTIDNSTAPAGSSDIYGIHSNGSGLPGMEIATVQGSSITVNSTNGGLKRGILIDTINDFHVQDTNIAVTGSGGSYIGVETTNNGLFTAKACSISGTTADISQTSGTITLDSTQLINSNANGLGFSTETFPSNIIWSDSGPMPVGTKYMYPGTETPSTNEVTVRASQNLIIKSLGVNARIAPGGGITDTWTVRKNGIDTPLVVTLTDSQTQNINNSVSVSYLAGDLISLQSIKIGGSSTSDIVLIMELY